jgi:hypothetical protein
VGDDETKADLSFIGRSCKIVCEFLEKSQMMLVEILCIIDYDAFDLS